MGDSEVFDGMISGRLLLFSVRWRTRLWGATGGDAGRSLWQSRAREQDATVLAAPRRWCYDEGRFREESVPVHGGLGGRAVWSSTRMAPPPLFDADLGLRWRSCLRFFRKNGTRPCRQLVGASPTGRPVDALSPAAVRCIVTVLTAPYARIIGYAHRRLRARNHVHRNLSRHAEAPAATGTSVSIHRSQRAEEGLRPPGLACDRDLHFDRDNPNVHAERFLGDIHRA